MLQDLSKLDLDFHGERSTYASHALHAFAAKFPPQLPGLFIDRLTAPGEVVLDPMNGSGTTTLEAYLRGRKGLGCDIDPLAVRIARAKATPLALDAPLLAETLVRDARRLLDDSATLRDALNVRFDAKTRPFVDYWFLPGTQRELMALLLAMDDYPKGSGVRELLEMVFSGIIVTKSGGVSRARDLAHSRPRIDPAKRPRDAIKAFGKRLAKLAPAVAALPDRSPAAEILQCSARGLPVRDSSVHLIVTSPPYANAIDYLRANKFSLVWLGRSMTDLCRLRGQYIGSEAAGETATERLPGRAEGILRSLAALDPGKARLLRRYHAEMREAFREMRRVLRPGGHAVVVAGTSTMRGLDVETPRCLAEIAEQDAGFEVLGTLRRSLDRDRRMLPFSRGRTLIERRMGSEEVIVMKTPG